MVAFLYFGINFNRVKFIKDLKVRLEFGNYNTFIVEIMFSFSLHTFFHTYIQNLQPF